MLDESTIHQQQPLIMPEATSSITVESSGMLNSGENGKKTFVVPTLFRHKIFWPIDYIPLLLYHEYAY